MPVELLRHITYTNRWEELNYLSPAPDLASIIDAAIIIESDKIEKAIAWSDGVPTIIVLPDNKSSVTFVDNHGKEHIRGAWFCNSDLYNKHVKLSSETNVLLIIRLNPLVSNYRRTREGENDLKDKPYSLEYIFGESSKALLCALAQTEGIKGSWCVMEDFLRKNIKRKLRTNKLFEEAKEAICKHRGAISVGSLTQLLRVNYKWLERNFNRYLGISPKEYARIQRILYCYNELKYNQKGILPVAIQGGFYDANHFIKEFKDFFGDSPLRYFENLRD